VVQLGNNKKNSWSEAASKLASAFRCPDSSSNFSGGRYPSDQLHSLIEKGRL